MGAPTETFRQVRWILACVLLAAGVAARIGNGWSFPVLGSYDAFSHFAYIHYLAETGQVPTAFQGWSYFHPPVYYAFMVVFWKLLAGIDALLALQAGRAAVALLGCLHAVIAWRVVRERFPDDPQAAVLAAGVPLFIPVMLYSAGFLGNEGLNAVLASASFYVLLGLLSRATLGRAALLGLLLGLGLLTKFSSITIVAGALATLALGAVSRGTARSIAAGTARPPAARSMSASLAVVFAVLLVVCGPYYARNLALYGKPFVLAREVTFLSAYVEDNQPQAIRSLADYLTFDPMIFYRPVWPRGARGDTDDSPRDFSRSVRESVWTGLYANTWFDGFGGWVLPPVTESEAARRAGQLLMTLGLVPTVLMLAGAWAAADRLRRRGWRDARDDASVAFGLSCAAMIVLFVYGTFQAPIAAAVKATYFTPLVVPFAYWLVLGVRHLRRHRARLARAAVAVCVATAMLSLLVFWQGLLFTPGTWYRTIPRYEDGLRNQLGVIHHAAGHSDRAKELFDEAAAHEYALSVENLGFLAIEQGRLREGLRQLRRASRLHRAQAEGRPKGRDVFLAMTDAELAHSLAVVLFDLGRTGRAEKLWRRTIAAMPEHAEARWSLSVSQLDRMLADSAGLNAADDEVRRKTLDDARRALAEVRRIDPGLREGWRMSSVVEALAGDCDAAAELAAIAVKSSWWRPRRFPVEAGNGAGIAASIGRRRLISPRSRALVLQLAQPLGRCQAPPPDTVSRKAASLAPLGAAAGRPFAPAAVVEPTALG